MECRVIGTAPLVATALYRNTDHRRCVDLFMSLLAREASAHSEATFLRAVAAGDFVPVEPLPEDYERMAALVE